MVAPKGEEQGTLAKRPRRACAQKRKQHENGEAAENGTTAENAPAADEMEPVPKKRRSKYSDVPPDKRLEQVRIANCARMAKSRRGKAESEEGDGTQNGHAEYEGG